MAEGLAIQMGEKYGIPISAKSCGTLGIENRSADKHAIAVCQEVFVDISHHQSTGVNSHDIEWADWVLVMELAHASAIRDQYPNIDERLLLLGPFGGFHEIPDPIGGWRFRFRKSRNMLASAIQGFIKQLPPTQDPKND